MNPSDNLEIATGAQIAEALGSRLEALRLSRNLTQRAVAKDAGISLSTMKRLEQGRSTSLDSFIRVLVALRLQGYLATLLPDPTIRPVERVTGRGRGERKRASSPGASPSAPLPWTWGDEDAP
jgi:transcriptional regulator with XRE-family HTH domain